MAPVARVRLNSRGAPAGRLARDPSPAQQHQPVRVRCLRVGAAPTSQSLVGLLLVDQCRRSANPCTCRLIASTVSGSGTTQGPAIPKPCRSRGSRVFAGLAGSGHFVREPVPAPAALHRRSNTTRFEFVPLLLLATPQQFAVLVNCCWLTSTSSGSNPAATAHGITVSSSRTLPPFTSPTSNATAPPAASTRCSSWNTAVIAVAHCGSVRAIVIGTASASTPQNQQRSQLSWLYCTTSRNGGEVTTSCTEP